MRFISSLALTLCTSVLVNAQGRTPPKPVRPARPAIAPIVPIPPVAPLAPLVWGDFADRMAFDWERSQVEWDRAQAEWQHLADTWDMRVQEEFAHDLATSIAEGVHLDALRDAEIAATISGNINLHAPLAPMEMSMRWPEFGAKGRDGTMAPQDSVYRNAREMLSRGEYRRAAALFAELAEKHATSRYAPDALYWQAFALYRIGATNDLRAALQALDAQNSKYPNARTKVDARALSTRIQGALAARGDATAARALQAEAAGSEAQCDREEQAVRVEALKAVNNSDPDGSAALLNRTLQRRDECSMSLRRTAVFLIGNAKQNNDAVSVLSEVARNDPSDEVRSAALDWLSRMPGDEALATIESISRSSENERMQRAAVRALVRHPSARARVMVRALVEREATPERLRLDALDSFNKEQTSADDIAWMRSLYAKTSSRRIKSRVVSTLAKVGGDDTERWLLGIARDEDEDSETRSYALRRVAETQPIAELARLYDSAAQRSVRSSLIDVLGRRSEEAATDKLIDIVKNGTDPQLRSSAIAALSRKKDPRTIRLLMELINR